MIPQTFKEERKPKRGDICAGCGEFHAPDIGNGLTCQRVWDLEREEYCYIFLCSFCQMMFLQSQESG